MIALTVGTPLLNGASTNPAFYDVSFWTRIVEISPAIAALLAVIYWLYRLIVAKDKTMQDLVRAGQGDIERQSKLITLLELVVQRHIGVSGRK